MALTLDFCLARADEAALAAEAAQLDNVKEIALRSEIAWRKMAKQIEAVQVNRLAIEQQKAEGHAAS